MSELPGIEPAARPDARVELRCQAWLGGADTLLATVQPYGNWVEWCRVEPLGVASP